MSDYKRNTVKQYLTAALLGLLAAAFAAYITGIADAKTAKEAAKAVCDGLFVAAVLLLSGGGFAFVSNEGGFDLLSYGGRQLAKVMKPGRYEREHTSYTDYVLQRRKKDKRPWLHIIIVGCGYLLMAFIALAIYSVI